VRDPKVNIQTSSVVMTARDLIDDDARQLSSWIFDSFDSYSYRAGNFIVIIVRRPWPICHLPSPKKLFLKIGHNKSDKQIDSCRVMNDSNSNGSNTQRRGRKQTKNRPSRNGGRRDNKNNSKSSRGGSNNGKSKAENIVYPPYWSLDSCLKRYNAKDPNVVSSTASSYSSFWAHGLYSHFFCLLFLLDQRNSSGFATKRRNGILYL